LMPGAGFLVSFPIIFSLSALGSIIGCFVTKPDDENVLVEFYKNVKPWGFWKPIYLKIKETNPEFKRNTNFSRDMLNSLVGIIWQMSLTVMPIFLVIREYTNMWIGVVVFVITSLILKFNWFDKLED